MNAHDGALTGNGVAATPGLVGPNAVLQLAGVLREQQEPDLLQRIFAAAGLAALIASPPTQMIDERIPARLFRALWQCLPSARCQNIAGQAGRRTADYIIANRIPGPAIKLFAISPPQAAAWFLLKAIEKHAWTFAGSGSCTTAFRPSIMIAIKDNPLAMQDCCWHRAVFERLFRRLVAHQTCVRHTACCREGAEACRFEIDIRS